MDYNDLVSPKVSQQIAESMKALSEYQAERDAVPFEMLDILQQMQEESKKESQLNKKRFIIQTVVSSAALIAAIVAAVATVISLM